MKWLASALLLMHLTAQAATLIPLNQPRRAASVLFECGLRDGHTKLIFSDSSPASLVLEYSHNGVAGEKTSEHDSLTYLIIPGGQSSETRLIFGNSRENTILYLNQAKADLPFGNAGIVITDALGVQRRHECVSPPRLYEFFTTLDKLPKSVAQQADYRTHDDPISLPEYLSTPCYELAKRERNRVCGR